METEVYCDLIRKNITGIIGVPGIQAYRDGFPCSESYRRDGSLYCNHNDRPCEPFNTAFSEFRNMPLRTRKSKFKQLSVVVQ